jgi:hypothetical protein
MSMQSDAFLQEANAKADDALYRTVWKTLYTKYGAPPQDSPAYKQLAWDANFILWNERSKLPANTRKVIAANILISKGERRGMGDGPVAWVCQVS